MESLELKSQLLKDIEAIQDVNLLKKLATFLRKEKSKDFADDLPQWMLNGIEEGFKDVEEGRFSTGEEVIQRLKAKRN